MYEPTDTVRTLKEQVAIAAKSEQMKPEEMRLILPTDNSVLEDSSEMRACEGVKNDSELHLVLQIADNEWESVQVESMEATPTN
jgi:mRNA-degrading endonuclease HigB of HigAB toxin-antitoxin module